MKRHHVINLYPAKLYLILLSKYHYIDHMSLIPNLSFLLFSYFVLEVHTQMQSFQLTQKLKQPTALKSEFFSSQNQKIINNYQQSIFSTQISIGSPGQIVQVIIDTGSHQLWVPQINCQCSGVGKITYNPRDSKSFINLNQSAHLEYVKGRITGYTAEDFIQFQNFKVFKKYIVANYTYTNTFKGMGLMGLSNLKKYSTIFDLAFQNGLLASNTLAIQLGSEKFGEKSYLYYNISENDFKGAKYVKAIQSSVWQTVAQGMQINGTKYVINLVVIDTGASLIFFQQNLYNKVDQQIFSRFCQPKTFNNTQVSQEIQPILRECQCDPKFTLPNFTIILDGISINITQNQYLYKLSKNKCGLNIKILPKNLKGITLGSPFLKKYVIILDKINTSIGFLQKSQIQKLYIQNERIILSFRIIQIFLIFSLVLILCHGNFAKTMLRTPLRQMIQMNNQTQEVQDQ